MNELVKVNYKDYGLTEMKAREVEAVFLPMIAKMKELEDEYNKILSLPIEEAQHLAKALRLKYSKIRTSTAQIHKEAKAFYLAGGRFVDGWKNAQLFASQGYEKKLKEIETHFERIEQEKINKRTDERVAEYTKYSDNEIPSFVQTMSNDEWDVYLLGVKKAKEEYLARQKAEAEAKELARIEYEAEQARIREENRILVEKQKEQQKELAKIRVEKEALEKKQKEEEQKIKDIKLCEEKKFNIEKEINEKVSCLIICPHCQGVVNLSEVNNEQK